MKNKIEDLRNHLFATLEDLRDKDKPLDIERAEAIAKVAQVIVNSATLEVKFMNAAGGRNTGTNFIPLEDKTQPAGAVAGAPGQPRMIRGKAQA